MSIMSAAFVLHKVTPYESTERKLFTDNRAQEYIENDAT